MPFLILCAFFFFGFTAEKPPEPVGYVQSVSGEDAILVKNPARNRARHSSKVLANDPIFVDDKIITQSHQKCTIVLDDKSEITIGPISNFTIEKFSPGLHQHTHLKLLYGMIHAVVRRTYSSDESFLVKTPSAAMGVRGTEFIVEVDSTSRATKVHTIQGIVAMARSVDSLRNSNASVIISAGQISSVRPEVKTPEPPRQFNMQLRDQKSLQLAPQSNPPSSRFANPPSSRFREQKQTENHGFMQRFKTDSTKRQDRQEFHDPVNSAHPLRSPRTAPATPPAHNLAMPPSPVRNPVPAPPQQSLQQQQQQRQAPSPSKTSPQVIKR